MNIYLYECNIQLFSLVEARKEVFKMVDADIIRLHFSFNTLFKKVKNLCNIHQSKIFQI
jgi:hypothetical protein